MIFMRPAFLLLIATSVIGMQTSSLFALIAPDYTERGKNGLPVAIKQRVVRPETYLQPSSSNGLSKTNSEELAIARDKVSDAPRLLTGNFTKVPVLSKKARIQSYAKIAREYIKQHANLFGVPSEDLKLAKEATLIDDDVQFIRFNVFRKGVQVADAHVSFRFKRGKLVQILNYSFAEAKESDGQDLTNLRETVRSLTGAHRVEGGEQLYRVSLDADQKGYLLTKVESYTITTHMGSFEAQIGTQSGKMFEIHDKHYHAKAGSTAEVNADIHKRWYNENLAQKKMLNLKVTTANGPIYTPVVATTDDGGNGDGEQQKAQLKGLNGKFVAINPVSGGRIDKTGELKNGKWTFSVKKEGSEEAWIDKSIAQWMVYYHVDAVNRRAKKYVSHSWLDETLQANVNLTRTCNAHWDGETINLYSGNDQCANTGLIADVIYHEWGHGLDDKTGGIADGAFSEGFGDIISLIMTHSNILGIGFRVPDHSPVRDLEPDKVYPDDRGEVHAEGLIIASTFWDLFKAFKEAYGEEKAAELIATYAFKMIFTAQTYLDVYQAILVIDDNDEDLNNGTPNMCTINEIFTKHGLATKDQNCELAGVKSFEVADKDGDGVIEPGEEVSLSVLATNKTSQTLSDLTGTLELSAGSGVTITQNQLSWPSLAGGETAKSVEPALLTVDATATCGSSFTTTLQLASQHRKAIAKHTFTIGKNGGTEETFAATGLPQPVLDNQTTVATANVTSDQWNQADAQTTVAAGSIKFSIRHTYVGDLRVSLVAPNGTEWEIYKGAGRGRNVDFQKNISELIAGTAGKGEWKLKVHDRARRDQGTLESFQLALTPSRFICN